MGARIRAGRPDETPTPKNTTTKQSRPSGHQEGTTKPKGHQTQRQPHDNAPQPNEPTKPEQQTPEGSQKPRQPRNATNTRTQNARLKQTKKQRNQTNGQPKEQPKP